MTDPAGPLPDVIEWIIARAPVFLILWIVLSAYAIWYTFGWRLGTRSHMEWFDYHWNRRSDFLAWLHLSIAVIAALGMIFVHILWGMGFLLRPVAKWGWKLVMEVYYYEKDGNLKSWYWAPIRGILHLITLYMAQRNSAELREHGQGWYMGTVGRRAVKSINAASKLAAGEDPNKPGILTRSIMRSDEETAKAILQGFLASYPDLQPRAVRATYEDHLISFFAADGTLVGEYDTTTHKYEIVIDG